MNDWLERAAAELAAAVGDDPSGYALSREDVDAILDLARVAARDSGARPNAPLVSYLVGLARGRHPERTLADLVHDVAGSRD